MAPHSSTLAWKIPWTDEPGRLQSMGSLRVGHDSATSLSLSLSCIGEGNSNPLQCSCLENPRDGGAWWATVYGVAQSWTRLKQLSSSSRQNKTSKYEKSQKIEASQGKKVLGGERWMQRDFSFKLTTQSFSDMVICEQRLDRYDGYLEGSTVDVWKVTRQKEHYMHGACL